MYFRSRSLTLMFAGSVLAGLGWMPFAASEESDQPAPKDAAKQSAKSTASLSLFKKLSGDWIGKTSHGGEQTEAEVNYRTTAAGSAVIETLFAGTEHEMVTMYHQNGSDLIMTHYCAAGNQPRMKAVPSENPKKVVFRFLDGTNLDPAHDLHMHEMTIEFVDDNHVQTVWTTYRNGKPMAEQAKFDLRRKPKK